jgi:hypothetical protein
VIGADDATVFFVWAAGFVGSCLAIIAVVALIYGITRTVLVIDERLDGVVVIGQRILDNTTPLFDLEQTAKLAETARSLAGSIQEDAGSVLQTVVENYRGG